MNYGGCRKCDAFSEEPIIEQSRPVIDTKLKRPVFTGNYN